MNSTTTQQQRAQLGTGASLAWTERPGDGHVVMLVHGYPLDRRMWTRQMNALEGHRIIAPDLRGSGESHPVGQPVTLGQHADDLAALLDHLEVRKVVLGGLSMGGYIALEFLARYRDRLSGLMLIDTRAAADSDEGRAGRDKAIERVNGEGPGAEVDVLAGKLFSESTPEAVRNTVLERMRNVPAESMVASLIAMRDRADHRSTLSEVQELPVLVVVGADDQLTPPSEAREMASSVEGAVLVELDRAGHLSPVEQPEEFNQAVADWLDRTVIARAESPKQSPAE